jgi:hypothetical protein
MPKISEEFASSSLKAEDLKGREIVLTIRTAELRVFKDDRGNPEKKVALTFTRTDKGFILNKTNRDILVKLYGDDTDDWIGKRIQLYPTEVQYGAKGMVPAIRIRPRVPDAAAPAPPPPPVAAPVGGDDDDIPF